MKRSKFTEERIAYTLRQVESGTAPSDRFHRGAFEIAVRHPQTRRICGHRREEVSSRPQRAGRHLAVLNMVDGTRLTSNHDCELDIASGNCLAARGPSGR